MTTIPPPYSSRDHAQVQSGPSGASGSATGAASASAAGSVFGSSQEFAETTSVCLEWRLTGLRAMYDSTRGEQKSKCIKSAVFGDADNLWEVLWYPNAGSSNQTAGDHVSLYLSCVPTAQERDSSINNKWTRKGLWWFKFEVRPIPTDTRGVRPEPLASKDASDHTFAVKTANWGWQAFAKRDALFLNPHVVTTDSFMIVCTIQPQPQPPAGVWLGIGLQPENTSVVGPNFTGGVGSGGGLSAWASANGSCGGVSGGAAAAGGVRRVVPRELVSSVGSMLDDPLYSDVEFVIPGRRGCTTKRIYANKKLLNRCEYFDAMFYGGFKEVEGTLEEDISDEEPDMLSDSDLEDEVATHAYAKAEYSTPDLHLTTTTSHTSPSPRRNSTSVSGDASGTATATASTTTSTTTTGNATSPTDPHGAEPHTETAISPNNANRNRPVSASTSDQSDDGAGAADITLESEDGIKEVLPKRPSAKSPALPSSASLTASSQAQASSRGEVVGPKKTKVIVRDAAWSTWWAVLYWIYTDIIYFAPLSSSFEKKIKGPSAPPTTSTPDDPAYRINWISAWMMAHMIDEPITRPPGILSWGEATNMAIGPRPVSAKSIYRLADKLDLPALKIRAFQHICSQLSAQNVPAEVFSRFSSTYEDVRRVQVAFFLKHWSEIKKSETMMQIWQQIRHGKHVGFEEVWPLIVGQLDFRPSP